MREAIQAVSVGKVSGAVGVYGHVQPEVEQHVCDTLGLRPDTVSTQVIARDHYAVFFNVCALVASGIERIATEIRHLQRTEVLEVEESFTKGQKGSSAMPHKRNPVLSENLTGLARVVRSYAIPALENIALWHERDISHSSVERVIAPDATISLDFMLSRLTNVIDNLIVYPENMKKNLERMGKLVFSEGVMLVLVESGRTREEAYKMVQGHAMRTWEEGKDFEELVCHDPAISAVVDEKKLKQIFQLEHHFDSIDVIFNKVFGE
jgi:adenylosuccinate lyase